MQFIKESEEGGMCIERDTESLKGIYNKASKQTYIKEQCQIIYWDYPNL